MTNDVVEREDVSSAGVVQQILQSAAIMQRSSRIDQVLALLASTVQRLTLASAVWAVRRDATSGEITREASVDSPHAESDGAVAAKMFQQWLPRLGAGHPPFDVDVRDTPLSGVGRDPDSSRKAIVFPMSSSEGIGAVIVACRDGGMSDAARALTALLCEQASMAMDLVLARSSSGRIDSLFGTLTQLTASYSDPDLVLGTIVRSAARLLGTDAAHVMLVDEDKSLLTVKTAFGITSKRFYEATCRTDELLPGAAIRTRRVVCVRDMGLHEQATHYQTEGVRSVMCAPMFVEDELVGVLLAGHREIRDPSPSDRALMGALASAAAVSITNARLYAEHERSIQQLGELNRLLATRSEALERTLSFQRRASALVLEGHGLEEIGRLTSEATGSVVVIVDRELAPLHPGAVPVSELGLDVDALATAIAECQQTPSTGVGLITIQPTSTSGVGALMAPVELGHDLSAYVLVVERDRPFDTTDHGILEGAVTAIGLELMRDRAGAEAEARVTGGLFQSLLSDEGADEATVLRRASYLGYELGGANLVVAVSPEQADPAHPDRFEGMIRRATRRLGRPAAVFERDATVFVVVSDANDMPLKKIKEYCSTIAQEAGIAGRRATVRIAHAGPHRGIPGVRRAVREAAYALHVQDLLGRTGVSSGFDELGIWALLGRVGDRDQLREFAESVLGRLVAYDEARGSDLIHTLQELAKCNYHYRSAAEALFAHPNTLRYRVTRITELAHLDLSDAEDRLRIELALRVLDVLGMPGDAPAQTGR